ncbi:MAG: hypothetical protein V2B14_02800, partial [bacterium]
SVVFIILNLVLMYISINYTGLLFAKFINFKLLLVLMFAYLFSRFCIMLVARFNFNDYKRAFLWIFFSPIIFFVSILQGFRINFNFKFNLNQKKSAKKEDYSKQIINTTVTNGKKELACKLEIRQNNNYSQIIFLFKDKKLTSSKHPRIDHALEELTEKLKSHGFALKVCMNCGYFALKEGVLVRYNGEQGDCLFENIDKGSKIKNYTYIWNSCKNIIPAQARNYILQLKT